MRAALLALIATVAMACSSDDPIWIQRSKSADPLYRFVKNGKAGYIDGTGRVVIKPTLEAWGNHGAEFHDGLLEIGVSNGRYIDRSGKLVIDKGRYRGWDFSEGLAVAMRRGESLWGYINTSGEFAISPRFASSQDDYVYPFSDGLAMIKVKGKFGYIDHSGEFVIKPEFLDGIGFSEGFARVVTEGPCLYFPDGACGGMNPQFVGGRTGQSTACKFAYIDKTGHIITQLRFDFGRNFSEGLAPVQLGQLWGFIDKAGSIVIAPKFEDAEPFSSGLARIRDRGLYGYADKFGTVVIPAKFEHAESFSEGFAVVGDRTSNRWYIEQSGTRAPLGNFWEASPFFKGLANVRFHAGQKGARFAYIDTKGRRVFEY